MIGLLDCLFSFSLPRANSIKDQQKIFWEQGDFGYLKNFLDSMMNLCVPQNKVGKSILIAVLLKIPVTK